MSEMQAYQLAIWKALALASLMNHSLASPGSVAHVMYEKYVNSVPPLTLGKGLGAAGYLIIQSDHGQLDDLMFTGLSDPGCGTHAEGTSIAGYHSL